MRLSGLPSRVIAPAGRRPACNVFDDLDRSDSGSFPMGLDCISRFVAVARFDGCDYPQVFICRRPIFGFEARTVNPFVSLYLRPKRGVNAEKMTPSGFVDEALVERGLELEQPICISRAGVSSLAQLEVEILQIGDEQLAPPSRQLRDCANSITLERADHSP